MLLQRRAGFKPAPQKVKGANHECSLRSLASLSTWNCCSNLRSASLVRIRDDPLRSRQSLFELLHRLLRSRLRWESQLHDAFRADESTNGQAGGAGFLLTNTGLWPESSPDSEGQHALLNCFVVRYPKGKSEVVSF